MASPRRLRVNVQINASHQINSQVGGNNFAPSIYGYNKIKEAILLQLFAGATKVKGDGIRVRGDIHMLLIGDPGAAKSQMLKAATRIAPKSTFVSARSFNITGGNSG